MGLESSVSITKRPKANISISQRASVIGLTGIAEEEILLAVAGSWEGSGHSTGVLALGRLVEGLLKICIERRAQLVGTGRVDYVVREDSLRGRSWTSQVASKSAGGEVSRAVVIRHVVWSVVFS